jgi:hypothetical protein
MIKKLLFLFSLLLLMSCEEPPLKTYKVELISGEVYHVRAKGYNWWRSGELEFHRDAGSFHNVKCVVEVKDYYGSK